MFRLMSPLVSTGMGDGPRGTEPISSRPKARLQFSWVVCGGFYSVLNSLQSLRAGERGRGFVRVGLLGVRGVGVCVGGEVSRRSWFGLAGVLSASVGGGWLRGEGWYWI